MFDEAAVSKVIQYYRWLAGISEREHDYHVTNYAAVLRQNFSNRLDFHVYDFKTDGVKLEEYGRFLMSLLSTLRATQYPGGLDERSTNFAGHTRMATTLLVGERAGGKINYPFGSRDSKLSSALWLNRALDDLDVSEHELCWVNALDGSWTETSTELLELLDEKAYRWKNIVALGQTAAKHLRSCGLREDKDFLKIPHPQWARKFKYRDFDWYRNLLGEMMGIKY
jgi:hypothetical protein